PRPATRAAAAEWLWTRACALVDQAGVFQDGVNALAFGFNEGAKLFAGQKVRLPTKAVHDFMPLRAVVQLGEAVDPQAVVIFRHIYRAQKTTPVGNFNVVTGFRKRGDVKPTHAFAGADCQKPDAPR